MYTDLKELRVRLECHFDMVTYEDGKANERVHNPLGMALLSAIELLKILEEDKERTVPQAVSAWQNRSKPRPSLRKSA